MASVVLGLTSVEVIERSGNEFVSRTIEPPRREDAEGKDCLRSPVAISAAALDDDPESELIVQDPCGNWVADAHGEGWLGVTNSALSTLPSNLYAHPLEVSKTLVVGSSLGLTAVAFDGSPLTTISIDRPLSVGVTDLFVETQGIGSERQLVVQQDAMLLVLPIVEGQIDAAKNFTLRQRYEAPYVAAFSGFDGLVPLVVEGCNPMALGIGLVAAGENAVPRRLQLLTMNAEQISDGEYETHELPMSPDVLSIAVARAPVASKLDLLVGAIRRDGSNHWFSVIGLGGCENWVLIGDVKIDFEITTPPAPAWGSVRHVPLTDHVVMIARDVEETNAVEFLHYDGYALRVGRVQHGDAEWNIEHTVVGMHTDRKDLSLLE